MQWIATTCLVWLCAYPVQDVPRDRGQEIQHRFQVLQATKPWKALLSLRQRRLLDLQLTVEEGLPLFLLLLDDPSRPQVLFALRALAEYGPSATPAHERVLQIFQGPDRNLGAEAARTLGSMGPRADTLTAFAESLSGEGAAARVVLPILGRFGREAASLLPVVDGFFERKHGYYRYLAWRAQGEMRALTRPAPPSVRTIAGLTDEEDGGYAVLLALQGSPDQVGGEHIAALLELLENEPPDSRRWVLLETLGSLGCDDPRAVEAMLVALESKSGFVRRVAESALQQTATSDTRTVDVLTRALENPRMRYHAVRKLAEYGERAAPATKALGKLVARACDPEEDGAEGWIDVGGCLDALRAIGPRAASTIPILLKLLPQNVRIGKRGENDIDDLRGYVLWILPELGPLPEAVQPRILEVLRDSSSAWLWAGAAHAAGSLGREMRAAVPSLVRALQGDGESWVSHIVDFHDSTHWYVPVDPTTCRIESMRALARILEGVGPDNPDARRVLPLLDELAASEQRGLFGRRADEEIRRARSAIVGG